MSQMARQAAEKLRQAGLQPLLELARRRVEERDGVSGTIQVDLSAAALAELANLLGWKGLPVSVSAGGPLRLRLADLDQKLRASRFAVGLLDVLAAAGGPVVTNRERLQHAADCWAAQLERIAAAAPADPVVQDWVAALGAGSGSGGRWYRRAYNDQPEVAERAALAVARALACLPLPAGELLAVFAARLTGDPHAFDAKQPAGALLLAALSERYGPLPEGLRDSDSRALLLGLVNLEVDGVSSTVLAAHLHMAAHPVVAAMAAHGGGWPLPLNQVRQLTLFPAPDVHAYVVENPQVFEYLVRGVAHLPPALRPPLVCTGGFLSAAAVRLLDLLHGGGCRLHYGGDFDRNGLAIANWLLARYPALTPWHMAPADYLAAAESGVSPFSATDLDWMRQLAGPLGPTARIMAERSYPAYQERLVEPLLQDLLAGR